LASEQASGVATRGAELFVRAQCAKCHRFDGQGESLGPDLTTVASRFTRKELIESIVHPSHTISSQYASKTIRTTDGKTLTGLVVPGAAGETVVILPTAERVSLKAKQIEEVADLFAYLMNTSKPPSLTRRPVGAAAK
jgi:putative heme-binding domain-containing protein